MYSDLELIKRIARKSRRYAARHKTAKPAVFIVTSNKNHPGVVLLPNLADQAI